MRGMRWSASSNATLSLRTFNCFRRSRAPSGESLPMIRYSAPYCERRSRSIARKTSESSSTLSNMGLGIHGLVLSPGQRDQHKGMAGADALIRYRNLNLVAANPVVLLNFISDGPEGTGPIFGTGCLKSNHARSEMKAPITSVLCFVVLSTVVAYSEPPARAASAEASATTLRLSREEYLDRVRAIWTAQMIAQITGLRFEHRTASTLPLTPMTHLPGYAPVDDDYYYEMVAIRAFEKYGIGLTVEQLGQQWLENNAGTWGSSEQALMLLKRGV